MGGVINKMGKVSYTIYGCKCDNCNKELFRHWGEEITSESELKDAINDLEWVEFVSGKILCKKCYDEKFENEE